MGDLYRPISQAIAQAEAIQDALIRLRPDAAGAIGKQGWYSSLYRLPNVGRMHRLCQPPTDSLTTG